MFISVTQHLNALKKVVARLEHRTKIFLKKVTKVESRDLSETFQPHAKTAWIKQNMSFGRFEFHFVCILNRFKRKNDNPNASLKKICLPYTGPTRYN